MALLATQQLRSKWPVGLGRDSSVPAEGAKGPTLAAPLPPTPRGCADPGGALIDPEQVRRASQLAPSKSAGWRKEPRSPATWELFNFFASFHR